VLGFLTGLYPVGFEGRIHYTLVKVREEGVGPRALGPLALLLPCSRSRPSRHVGHIRDLPDNGLLPMVTAEVGRHCGRQRDRDNPTPRGQQARATEGDAGQPTAGGQPTVTNKRRMPAGKRRRWAPRRKTPAGIPLMYSWSRPPGGQTMRRPALAPRTVDPQAAPRTTWWRLPTRSYGSSSQPR